MRSPFKLPQAAYASGVFRRCFGTDSAYVKTRRAYQLELHRVRKEIAARVAAQRSREEQERAERKRLAEARQRQAAVEQRERIEQLHRELKAELAAMPTADGEAPSLAAVPIERMERYKRDYGAGTLDWVKRSLVREAARERHAAAVDPAARQAQREAHLRQSTVRQHATEATLHARNWAMASLLAESSRQWITPANLDTAAEQVLRDLYIEPQRSDS